MRSASFISINQPGASNDRFISFTGDHQISSLVQVAKSQGFGGVMEFEVQFDFVSSQSGDARHPLAASVYAAVFGSQPPAAAPTAPPPPVVTTSPVISTPVVTAPAVQTNAITTGGLVSGHAGVYYIQSLDSSLPKPIAWSVSVASLPPGLTLNSSTGVISGVPAGVGVWGFTIHATSSAGAAAKAFTIMIN